jgi:hypothetical protein
MSPQPPESSVFSINVSASPSASTLVGDASVVMTSLLGRILDMQQRQCKLLEELLQATTAAQRGRNVELNQWKQANPHLARGCRVAAEKMAQVQSQFLENMTNEIAEHAESMTDGDFMLYEFVDRFGPRLAHLNGVLQVLAQLGSATSEAKT